MDLAYEFNMQNTNPNTQVVKVESRASALTLMAQRFNVEPNKLLGTLKSTVFKGASDDELMALVIVANEYNLNPLKKEIYAFPAKGGGITPVVGVDGWINIMNSRANFDGIEFEMEQNNDGEPISCTAIIHVKDRSRPVKVTEYYEECQRATDPWKQMPRRMLRNRALAQAVRIAFTAGGIIDEDEAGAMLDPVATAKPVQGTVTEPTKRAAKAEKVKESETTRPAAPAGKTKKDLLGEWMTEKQYTWPQIQPILTEEGVLADADAIATFDDLTETQAIAIFGVRSGLESVIGGAK
jgi:phage recombination protein Bet